MTGPLSPSPARWRAACLLGVVLGACAVTAQAVEFDEKLRAPLVVGGATAVPQLESYISRAKVMDQSASLAALRDASFGRQQADLRWTLGRIVDSRQPAPELEALGFVAKPDGGYEIDIATHPEWRPLKESLVLLEDDAFFGGLRELLLSRGLRPQQFDLLQAYVDSHDLAQARAKSKLDLLISAGKVARKLQKLKRPIDDAFVWSVAYQKAMSIAEVERQWAAGLMNALEPQSQRILASYLSEHGGALYIGPTSNEAAIGAERELLLRPDLEQVAKTAFKEGTL